MLYSKIMVPYDGSEHAKHALEYAKGLAAISDAKIAIVHVVPSGVMGVDQIGTEGSLDGVPFGMLNLTRRKRRSRRIWRALSRTSPTS